MSHDIDRFSVVHFLEGCFLSILFTLEPHSATPSTPTSGLCLCGWASTGTLGFTQEFEHYPGSTSVGMFADGGLHEIAVSISRESRTITYYLDQKVMSTQSFVSDNGDGSGKMPTFPGRQAYIGRNA
jgi:hypothetical protein